MIPDASRARTSIRPLGLESKTRIATRVLGVALCIALISSMIAAPTAAQSTEERFLVELNATGDADVSVTLARDLDGEDETAAFDVLRENETARAQLTERFENRMASVAADASAATDREMNTSDASIQFRETESVGLITLSIRWSNLAAVDGDQLRVTEPFASGFESEQPFVVSAPDGHVISSTEPTPSSEVDTSATWAAGTSLEGFEVAIEASNEATSTDDAPDESTTDDSPGFGVVVAVLALLAAALLAIRAS
jgi:PGF-CTERM protein